MFNEIVAKIDALLQPEGFECIELVIIRAKQSILRLFVDKIGTNSATATVLVSVEDCERVSRILESQPWLDELISGPYCLEVSSPGLERPLRFARHISKQIGQKVAVQLTEKVDQKWQGQGVLRSFENEQIKLETEQGSWEFPLALLKKANLVYEWK